MPIASNGTAKCLRTTTVSLERREMTTDSERDYYRQEWFSLRTGERTYFKEGKLSDPDTHGQSARRPRT
jgi:hypothetical protein